MVITSLKKAIAAKDAETMQELLDDLQKTLED